MRSRPAQNDWSWGELSDEAAGRMDLVQYGKSARRLVNYRPIELGGATRRAGTRFIARAKHGDRIGALIPFVFSQGEAYMLEVSEGGIRLYRNRSPIETAPGVPLEVATTFQAPDVQTIKVAQSADVLYLAHNFYHPQKLERYGDLTWKLRPVSGLLLGSYGLTPPPSMEYGARPPDGCTLTPDAVAGLGVTVTAGADFFRPSDVGTVDVPGREIIVFDGASIGARMTVVSYVSPTVVTVNIDAVSPFADLNAIPAEDWKLTRSPLTGITPQAKGPVNSHITLTLDDDGWRPDDAISVKFCRLNGGLVEINDFGSGFDKKIILGTIRVAMTTATKALGGSWSIEESAWSSHNGYPAAVVLGKGRAWWAGTLAQPTAVWGSVAGDFENFAAGILDDDSVADVLVNGQVNAILWLAMTDNLYAGTRGEIYRISAGGSGDIITPTNVDGVSAMAYGARAESAPLSIPPALIYPTLSGRKLREMTFDVIYQRHLAPDLLLLANHMTRPLKVNNGVVPQGITRLAFQKEPISTIWAATESGKLFTCTYLRDQNVVAWSRVETQGEVLDVAVIPREDGTGDEVWLLVRRIINGTTEVFVEWVDDRGLVYDTLLVDCGVTVDGTGTTALVPGLGVMVVGSVVAFLALDPVFSVADVGRQLWQIGGPGQAEITAYGDAQHVTGTIIQPFSTDTALVAGSWGVARQVVGGLDHLNGAEVVVSGDGAPQSDKVVGGSQIVADDFAIAFEIGLGYVSTLETQRPVIPDPAGGGTQGQPKAQPEVLIRLQRSLGLKVNGRKIPFRSSGMKMGQPPVLFTGDKKASITSHDGEGILTLVQDQPLPSTILYIQALTDVGTG